MLRIIKKYMGSAPFLQCGLDFSQSSIKAVLLQHNRHQIQLHDYQIVASLEELKAYLISHFSANECKGRVVFAAAEAGLFNQMIESPTTLTSAQLDEQIQWVLKRHFSLPATGFYYDYHPINAQKLWLTAIPREQVADKLAWLQALGLQNFALDTHRFALARLNNVLQNHVVINVTQFEWSVVWVIDQIPVVVHQELVDAQTEPDIEAFLQRCIVQEKGLIAKSDIHSFYLTGDALEESLLNHFFRIAEKLEIPIVLADPFKTIQVDSNTFANLDNDKHSIALAVSLARWQGTIYDVLQ